MSILTDSIAANARVIDIYDWSIRKVVFRHNKYYESFLIGYVPGHNKLEIACIKRFYLKERLISEEGIDDIYYLYGQSGLTDEAEKIWGAYKICARIVYEIDITHKYKNQDDDLYHNKMIERYGQQYYMIPDVY